MRPVPLVIATITLLLSGCGTPTASAPSPSATSGTTAPLPSASPTPTHLAVPLGASGFRVADGSKAVIRVNEQLANVQLPGEAVVTTTAMDGEFVLLPDGSFASGSKIRADLERLKSDSELRDEWIRINTLQTRQFRFAEFAPARITGIALPLPASGTWNAKLEGTMKVKSTERRVTWDVVVTRDAGRVTTNGSITFRFGDFGMDVPSNRLVLSVKDEVRLQVDLVATEVR